LRARAAVALGALARLELLAGVLRAAVQAPEQVAQVRAKCG
jgi:hypothetical protein